MINLIDMETNEERLEAKLEIDKELSRPEKRRLRFNAIYKVIVREHRGAGNVAPYAQIAEEAQCEPEVMECELTISRGHVSECVRLLNSQKRISGINTNDSGVYYDNSKEAQMANITEKCNRILAMKLNVSSLLGNYIRDFGAESVPDKIYDFIEQFGGLSIDDEDEEEESDGED